VLQQEVRGGRELGDVRVERVADPDEPEGPEDQLVAEDQEREEKVEPETT
jgi:hypothetical protein